MGNPSPIAASSTSNANNGDSGRAQPHRPTYDISLGFYPSENLWERLWEFHSKYAPGQAQYLVAFILLPQGTANIHPAVVARLVSKFISVKIVSSGKVVRSGPLESPKVEITEDFTRWNELSDMFGRRTVDIVVVPEGWERLEVGLTDPGLAEGAPTVGFEREGVLLREIRRMLKPAPCGTLITYSHPYPAVYSDQPMTDLIVSLYNTIWYTTDSKPQHRTAVEQLWQGLEVTRSAWKQGVEERLVFPIDQRTPFFAPERFLGVGELERYLKTRPEHLAATEEVKAKADEVIGKIVELGREKIEKQVASAKAAAAASAAEGGESKEEAAVDLKFAEAIELEVPCVAVFAKVER